MTNSRSSIVSWSRGPGSGSDGQPPTGRIFFAAAVTLSVATVSAVLIHLELAVAIVVLACLAALAWRTNVERLTGIFLLLMPLQWLVIALLQLDGVAHYELISATKEVILASVFLWFAWRTPRFKFTLPDAMLCTMLLIVLIEQVFYTDVKAMRDDWEWALPYMIGRVLPLNPEIQAKWAKAAVWMCVALTVAGGWEVFFLGSGPRLLLLNAVEGDVMLPPPFSAVGYSGLRAASTMVSPLSFSALCMVALVLWWVYMKNPIPAVLIATGLVLTVTRSAIVATVVVLLVIGIRRREYRRVTALVGFVAVAVAIAIPTLNLNKFISSTASFGGDASLVGHASSLRAGFDRMIDYPLGTGAGTASPRKLKNNAIAFDIESSYLTMAVEYGVVVGVLYAGFFAACMWRIFKVRGKVGLAAFSIVLGYGLLLSVGSTHQDIPLACWVWVPIGLAVAESSKVSQFAIPQTIRSTL